MTNKEKLVEATIKALAESNDKLYYARYSDFELGWFSGPSKRVNYYITISESGSIASYKLERDSDVKYATILPKEELLSRLDKCSEVRKLEDGSYLYKGNKLVFRIYEDMEKYTSGEDYMTLTFVPQKGWDGTLNIAQFKQELKKRDIKVAKVSKGKKYYKYGEPEDCYKFYISTQYKQDVEDFVKWAENVADVSLIG